MKKLLYENIKQFYQVHLHTYLTKKHFLMDGLLQIIPVWSFHEVQKAFIVDSLPQTLSILGVEQHDYCDSEIELQMQTYIFHPLLHYDFSWNIGQTNTENHNM